MFEVNSRYHDIPTKKMVMKDGKEVVYLQRRFIPLNRDLQAFAEHVVTQDERLDSITARYLDDPELFWHLCDVNNAMWPDELTETIGRRLTIPFIQGV